MSPHQRHWQGYDKILASGGHWSATFGMQGSFECPTAHMSFELIHRAPLERKNSAEYPAIQPCLEGRWHVYHVTIEGRRNEMKELEEKQKRLGGPAYDWHLTMLLHESKPLDRDLVDKVMSWHQSSLEHSLWFGANRVNRQRKAFYVDKDDWSSVKQILPGTHDDMIFIGHPEQCVDDIVNTCGTEQVFDHGCLLPKVGDVFAIKDDYGFVLVFHER